VEFNSVTKGDLQLEYLRFGRGQEVLICFHGFGRKAEDFLFFREELEANYTVYSFNFFHHGNSQYPENRIEKDTFRKEELYELFANFLQQENIDRFSLMGYSMGGKISLELLHHFHSRIHGIFLLAPDGIKTNFWYRFTSRNKLGNMLYRKILKNPEPFFRLLNFIRKLRLVSDKIARFAKSNMETREKRELVFKVWMTLRHIEPSSKKSAELIRQNNIQCFLLFGKYDKVIVPKTGKWFAKKIANPSSMHEVECGHNMFNERTKIVLQEIVKRGL
jgi:pimeloyl-ACP methyl ester carboxylesterase